MYVHAKTLGWLTRPGARNGGLTLRKGVYTSGFALAHALMCSSVSVARWLDRFLYPAFELTAVTPPLFVIATPRSGTTFLHHLLALDDERFVSFKLYQTLAPSVLLERAIVALRDLDEQAGSASAACWTPSIGGCSPPGTAFIGWACARTRKTRICSSIAW